MSHSYPQLSAAQQHSYAMKAQRAWHWSNYDAAQQRVILARVQRLIAAQPGSYLARHWREVYR